jgi:hypothetical protein
MCLVWGKTTCKVAAAEVCCSLDMQVLAQTPGVYVPQLGDDVVYLQQGHRLYFEKMNDKRRGPWDTVISNAVSTPFPIC